MTRASNTDARRDQIAKALEKVMARKGYDGASIADVAKEAGLTTGLVHYHFESKLEILHEVLARLAAEHEARLDRALEPARADVGAELEAFIDAHLALGRDADPDALACWIMLSGEALREASVREAYANVVRSTVGRLAGILRRGVRAKRFRAVDVDAAASALVATIEGYYILAATARELIPRASAAKATKAMAEGLLRREPVRRKK